MDTKWKNANEEFDRWSKEIKRGVASLAILTVIKKKESYGYEIVKNLNDMAGTLLNLEQGTVYPILKRLETVSPNDLSNEKLVRDRSSLHGWV